MFLGTFEHALDDKGRVVVPSAFRGPLAEGGVVAKLDQSIGLWLPEGFEARVQELRDEAKAGRATQNEIRTYLSEAAVVKPDGAGRIWLPGGLRLHAGLDEQVVFTGFWSRVEIWDETRWRAVRAGGDDVVVEAIEAAGQ